MTQDNSYALSTDFYELTMMQGYFLQGLHTTPAVFDMFFRRLPFNGGYAIFAGLDDFLRKVERLRFSPADLEYLDSLGKFTPQFLDYLGTFTFSGDIYSFREGTVCFPVEPLVRIHANIAEAQLLESLLLNTINYQTLIATKAARMYYASGCGHIVELGLRRAHGIDGALSASRAAYIGGAEGTSNVLAGQRYNIPVVGTMAHSWIMAHQSEEDAFRNYAKVYPDACTFLLDTYDTVHSGLPNAVRVGKELVERGKKFGVRLDSGDIEYLSKQVRAILDTQQLQDVTIMVSNDLNEYIIHELVSSNCPVNYWGVGGNLVCAPKDAMLSGVYKLAAINRNGVMHTTMKTSDNPQKSTLPGIKQVYRLKRAAKQHELLSEADLITFTDEPAPKADILTLYHPAADFRHFALSTVVAAEPLLHEVMRTGKVIKPEANLSAIQQYMKMSLSSFDTTYKRILNPHLYKVSISGNIRKKKLAAMGNSIHTGG